jgi:hypothetical protein
MNFLLGRDGKFSALRAAILVAVLGTVFVIFGVIFFFVDRASREGPFNIEVYPGAAQLSDETSSPNSRTVFYSVQGATAEDVTAHYQRELTEFAGGDVMERCVRFPAVGNFQEFDRGEVSSPFEYSCMFDNSAFGMSQYTRVNIFPWIEANQPQDLIYIEYDQIWQ